MANKPSALTEVICASIDHYRLSQKPNLTIREILMALEYIRHGLTERALQKINAE